MIRTPLAILGTSEGGEALAASLRFVGEGLLVLPGLAAPQPEGGEVAAALRTIAVSPDRPAGGMPIGAALAGALRRTRGASPRLRLEALGAAFRPGTVRFLGAGRLDVAGEVVEARRVVLATGLVPRWPAIDGLDTIGALVPADLATLDEVPERLAVLGSGGLALELAQAMRRLGSQVLVMAGQACPAGTEPELASLLLRALRAEGIVVLQRVRIERVARGPHGAVLDLGGERPRRIEASHVLLAEEEPGLGSLGLDRLGLRSTEHGLPVDRTLRAPGHPWLFALGAAASVEGRAGSVSHGRSQAEALLARLLLGLPRTWPAPPRFLSVATDPGLAETGMVRLPEDAARRGIRLLRLPVGAGDAAGGERAVPGLVRVLADRRGRVLGAGLVASGAGELVLPFALAVAERLPLRALAGLVPAPWAPGSIVPRAAVPVLPPPSRGLDLLRRWRGRKGDVQA